MVLSEGYYARRGILPRFLVLKVEGYKFQVSLIRMTFDLRPSTLDILLQQIHIGTIEEIASFDPEAGHQAIGY
jgi:hypothetical protein